MSESPIHISPYPSAKDFAVTFVDDTDYATVQNTQPVYEFVHHLGFAGTKTVWPLAQQRSSAFRRELERPIFDGEAGGSSLEDSQYLSYVLGLKDKGFEIALHGVAGGNSYRAEILSGLDRFRTLFGQDPNINVFHARNIDNLYCGAHKLDIALFRILERLLHRSDYQGHIKDSPYFWGDFLRSRIKYVRLPFHTIPFPNTLKFNPTMPFHDPRRPFVSYWFASSDGSDCARFVKLLREENGLRLKRERGACIVYTHFAKGFLEKTPHGWSLNPAFAVTMERLADFKTVWCPTASELLDRLLATRHLSIDQQGYEVKISNRSDADLTDVTFYVPSGVTWRDEIGTRYHAGDSGIITVPMIPARRAVHFTSSVKQNFLAPRKSPFGLPRWERSRIEIINYYGQIRDYL